MRKQLLLVVGPGRSGTSVFSALGQRLGFHIPQPEVSANETNPKGFGEPQWVVDFHTELLGEGPVLITDARPQAWDRAREVGADPAHRRRLRRWLEQEFTDQDRILVKDPRTLWFFELWQEVADELGIDTNYVTMLRHPAEVILSRHTWYSTRVPTTGVLSGLLNTMLGTERLTRGAARAFVDFDDLMADWQKTLTRVDAQLGTSLLGSATEAQRTAADGLIDPDLRRSVASWDEVEVHERLRALAVDCWVELDTLAEDPTDLSASRRLDEHRRSYDQLYDEAEAIATSSAIALLREERATLRKQARQEARAKQGPLPMQLARLVPKSVRHAIPLEMRQRAVSLVRRDSRPRAATTGPAPERPVDPRASWRERQELVLRAVEATGCPSFLVPQGATTWSLAVPETHRRDLLDRLARIAPPQTILTAIDERGRTTATWTLPSPFEDLEFYSVPAIRVHDTTVAPGGVLRPSTSFRCEVEFWATDRDGTLLAPRRNAVGVQAIDPGTIDATPEEQRPAVDLAPRLPAPSAPVLRVPAWDEVTFPVDMVFLWVDSSDPEWNAQRRRHATTEQTDALHFTSTSEARFRDRDELRYALRSVHYYAPWVRHIHLVTAGQRPDWLADSDRLTIVDHSEIFEDDCLPTFNSNAIISRLHHIPGLADHYVLMNDDVFLGRPVSPNLFFTSAGAARFFLSPRQISMVPDPAETALDTARRRVRETLLREQGRHATQLLYHTPHPQRASWHHALEDRFPKEYGRTARHRFRDPDDLEPLLLHHYLGYREGMTEPGRISYRYAQTGSRDLTRTLDRLTRKPESVDAFCLNDVAMKTELDADTAGELLRDFLTTRFPVAAPWERPGN